MGDLEVILNSHVHYDHAGGIAELQQISAVFVSGFASTHDVVRRVVAPGIGIHCRWLFASSRL